MKTSLIRSRVLHASALVALVTGVVLTTHGAIAQPQPGSPEPTPQAQPAPGQPPGVFESIGRFFDQGAANFRDSLNGAKQKLDEIGTNASRTSQELGSRANDVGKGAADVGKGVAVVGKGAADATKDAVEAIVKLPNARVVKGRENCGVAANGAPDCQAAAQALCRKQGYASGKSMDFTSAEQCPARVWLSGRNGGEGCTTVTFISQAMCQ